MKIIKSHIIPLQRKDVDTDLIIPADFLRCTTREGLGKYLFDRVRKIEPDFPFNLPQYFNAKILVADDNFGCGSSREHAAWAISDWGIEVIVAPSFADIFHANALKNGILLVQLPQSVIDEIFAEEDGSGNYEIEVDLIHQQVTLPNNEKYNFKIDPYRKECLIKGIDDMEYLLNSLNES